MIEEIRITNLNKESLQKIIENTVNDQLQHYFSTSEDKKRTIDSVAVEFSVDPLTVRNWIKKGIVPASRIGRRIYILQKDLDKALSDFKSLKYKRV